MLKNMRLNIIYYIFSVILILSCSASTPENARSLVKRNSLSRNDPQSTFEEKSHRNVTLTRLRHPRDQYSSALSYKLPKNYALGHGWNPRQISSFASSASLLPSQNPPNEYAYAGAEEEISVSADSHGQGLGWGEGKGCNSALGLLGVLGLASYLQNVLRQMSNTGTGTGSNLPGGIGGGGGINLPGGGGAGGGINLPGGGKRSTREIKTQLFRRGTHLRWIEPKKNIISNLQRMHRISKTDQSLYCSSYTICKLSSLIKQARGTFEERMLKRMLSTAIELTLKFGNASRQNKIKLIEAAKKLGNEIANCKEMFNDCTDSEDMVN